MLEKNWKYDADYISYIESGESAAVFIVRDIVNTIDTKNKWIDVISLNTYDKKGAWNRKAFNWIIVELFPRKLKPEYDKSDSDHNKYLTWVTAHADIDKQRRAGFHGEKYLVLCNLFNKNKNKFTTRTIIARKYWEPMEAYRPMEIKEPIDPDWDYRIQAVKKVNNKQVNYIINHEWEIKAKIIANGKPTLEILGL
ncbi:MAG: hypothetical protein HDT40_03165 [Lachnospiraceae bacterium]|nr:hypothetical protein [Lachnospiraceae bacterium]